MFFNTLIHGSLREKCAISYGIIDSDSKGYFTLEDVVELITGMLDSNNRRFDLGESHDLSGKERVGLIYQALLLAESFYYTIDSKGVGIVKFEVFFEAVQSDNSLLDFFSLILNGMSDGFIYKNIERLRLETFINRLKDLQKDLGRVKKIVSVLLERIPELEKVDQVDPLYSSTILTGLKGFQKKRFRMAERPQQPKIHTSDFDGTESAHLIQEKNMPDKDHPRTKPNLVLESIHLKPQENLNKKLFDKPQTTLTDSNFNEIQQEMNDTVGHLFVKSKPPLTQRKGSRTK